MNDVKGWLDLVLGLLQAEKADMHMYISLSSCLKGKCPIDKWHVGPPCHVRPGLHPGNKK